jgi:hypothetical protein
MFHHFFRRHPLGAPLSPGVTAEKMVNFVSDYENKRSTEMVKMSWLQVSYGYTLKIENYGGVIDLVVDFLRGLEALSSSKINIELEHWQVLVTSGT